MDIFKNIQFLKLWGNQILLQIAFNMANFTALLLINQITGSRFALAEFYAAMTLPAFLIGFFAGSMVDISDRKKLMLITDALLAGLFFLYAFSTHNVLLILAIAFISAGVSQFFTPAEAATIPLLVSRERFKHANSLFLFTQLGSVMLGYALAGPVIDLFGGISGKGFSGAFIVAGALTAFGFLLRLSLKTIEHPHPQTDASKVFSKAFKLTKEVLTMARKNHRIYIPISLLALMEFNIGMLSILFIDYVKKYLQLPITSTSYFLVLPLILGLGIGVLIIGPVEKWLKRGHSIFLGIAAWGLVMSALGISAMVLSNQGGVAALRIITMVVAFVIGISAVLISVHARTVLQETTPENMLGRVFSLVTIAISAMTPIPVLLVALLTEKIQVPVIFIGFGILMIIFGLIIRPTLHHKLSS